MPESQPLLTPTSSPNSSSVHPRRRPLRNADQHQVTNIWHLSKAATALIAFHFIVGAACTFIIYLIMVFGYKFGNVSVTVMSVYSFHAFVTLFYPLSGFMADVCCGRYRVISAAFVLMLATYLGWSLTMILAMSLGIHNVWSSSHLPLLIPVIITTVSCYILFVFGLAGYQANYIQFGLDQLLEAPSVSLALFIHFILWANGLGTFIIQVSIALILCNINSPYDVYGVGGLVLCLMVCFIFVVIFLRRRWFYCEPGHYNPYKMVVKVLNFARKHKYPLQRSAFTYCDDEEPSRIDFAKKRYGGPFTTEQVEDVKTFFKILCVLLTLGPVFVLELPSSSFVSILFGLHIRHPKAFFVQSCSVKFILFDQGSFGSLLTVVVFPVYMKIVFSLHYHRMAKITPRLTFAVVTYILGVASMLFIDLAGHTVVAETSVTGNSSMCMFSINSDIVPPSLHLPTLVLIIPGVFIGIGKPLVMATSFEFISAQSPSSMKGLLVGVFFTIKAFFQLISGAALIPFAYKPLWNNRSMREHPPVTNCGFGYLSFTCVVALIGLVVFAVTAKLYRYRQRDDRPYDQRFAVDVYSRYLQ